MKIFLVLLFSLFQIILSTAFGLTADQASGEHLKIRVIAPEAFSSTEETVIGILFEPDDHWHVYWKNPGDSGTAPKFKFETDSAIIGNIQWPAPSRIPLAHLTNLGYEGRVAYLFTLKPDDDDAVEIKMDLEWLVCKVECIPGFATIQFKRPVKKIAQAEWSNEHLQIINEFQSQIPKPESSAPFTVSGIRIDGDLLQLKLNNLDEKQLSQVQIFPENSKISPAQPAREKNEFSFKLSETLSETKGLGFVARIGNSSWSFGNIEESRAGDQMPIWLLIFAAVAGGAILNLMPCVFPVIFIKAFSLLKTTGRDRIRDCLLYSLGVVTTFLLLGVLFLGLRKLGMQVGWGFQLQSPLVILGLIILFWLMALNFLGVFEFGTSTMNFAGGFISKTSSFGTGVLSVFVAAPCTSPFMGTALGAAIVLPPLNALMIFVGLGIGLALPFLFFATVPKTLNWLPKPGAWMEHTKNFFAFPLFATVLWLLWILGQQASTQGWLVGGVIILLTSIVVWILRLVKTPIKYFVVLIYLVIAFFFANTLTQNQNGTSVSSGPWAPYDETKLKEAQSKGQAVFVDFTAAWCITCQVNKQTVLDTARGREIFKSKNIFLMRADWTRYDVAITQALSKLGRSSVPVYAFYGPDRSEPVLLPQILTFAMIEELKVRKK